MSRSNNPDSPLLHALSPKRFGGGSSHHSHSSGGLCLDDFDNSPTGEIEKNISHRLGKKSVGIEGFSPALGTLKSLRDAYLSGFIYEAELETLISKYESWVTSPVYLCWEKHNQREEKIFRLASKRGNSVYRWKTLDRLEKATWFFDTKEFQKLLLRREGRSWVTNVLFISLTNDSKRYGERKSCFSGEIMEEGDRIKAWTTIQHDYNNFITAFRKRYGKAWALKSFESTEKGYPHIHIFLITEKSWKVHSRRKRITKKNGEVRWISEYRLGKNREDRKEKDKISELWHSFVDIKCPVKVNAVKNYVYKDIVKQFKGDLGRQNKLSLTLNWLFRKRSFSVSGEGLISEFINERVTQTQNPPKIELFNDYEFVGLVKVHFKTKEPPFSFQILLSGELETELEECLLKV